MSDINANLYRPFYETAQDVNGISAFSLERVIPRRISVAIRCRVVAVTHKHGAVVTIRQVDFCAVPSHDYRGATSQNGEVVGLFVIVSIQSLVY